MKIIILVLAMMFAACTTEEGSKGCGEFPNAPGVTAVFDMTPYGLNITIMTRDDYENMMAWREHVTQWGQCMTKESGTE